MIIVESKRKKPATVLKKYPNAILADVTSGAKDGLRKLSPFYPHGGHHQLHNKYENKKGIYAGAFALSVADGTGCQAR